MKKYIQLLMSAVFIVLCVLHVYLFVSGITLGDEINKYETSTKKLTSENIDLEKKLYTIESLTYAASQAAKFDYTQKASPIYLDNLRVALNR